MDHPLGEEIQVRSNVVQGFVYISEKKGNTFKKIVFSRTASPNGTIFSIDHPKDKYISSQKVPGVTNGHTLSIDIVIYKYKFFRKILLFN